MSNNSVIEHRANYYYVMMQEDYLAICSNGKCSPHCKAMILSVLESWTNTKHGKGEGDFVYLTMPQWIKYTYMLYERNIITDCIKELLEEGLIARQSITMFFQKTFEYKLCTEKIQELIRALPVKGKEEAAPNLEAYLAFKDRGKVKRDAKKKLKEVGEKSRTGNNDIKEGEEVGEKSRTVREKSPEVGDNSPKVGEKSPQLIYTYNPLQPSNNQGYDVASANRNDTPAFLSENKMGEELSTPGEQLSPTSVDNTGQNVNQPSVPEEKASEQSYSRRTTPNSPSEKPKRVRKPKVEDPKTTERIDKVVVYFDQLLQEVTGDANAEYGKTKAARTDIKDTLLPCNPTEKRLRKIYLALWNTPPDPKTGFHWRDNMSIKAVCKQYQSKVIGIIAEEQKEAGKQKTKKVMETVIANPSLMTQPEDDYTFDINRIRGNSHRGRRSAS